MTVPVPLPGVPPGALLSGAVLVGASLAYLLALFTVAWWADRRAASGRSVIGNAWVYALSMGVYCTAWTYFGSVGRAAAGGVWFLPIDLGPTLAMVLAWPVLRKMIRIARSYRITSIADFIASRYGKSRALAGLVTLMLPRQFQVMVVENVDERHVKRTAWAFPAYLLLINLFVLPIAFGGLSAATGMVVVEAIAVSTMVCNDLVLPLLLRRGRKGGRDQTRLLLFIRRAVIVGLLLLGWLYYRVAGEAYALVSIGLISFAAVAQFAPALLGGMFWKGGTRNGALAGLSAGALLWLWTLLLPSVAKSGWIDASFVLHGPFGIALLRPEALLGLTGMDNLTHALFWSQIGRAHV